MSSTRRHTIVAGQNGVGQLEKDWFSYAWASGWDVRHVIARANHQFHVVSNRADFSRQQAEKLVDAALAGKTDTVQLRDFNR